MQSPIALLLPAVLLMGAAPADGRRISLDVKDAELRNVLAFLADVGKVNLVVSDDVAGKVTIRLKNVPWSEAFGAILAAKGLGQERVGEIIHVDTLEKLSQRDEIRARTEESRKVLAPLKTVLIPVRYARAAELVPMVKTVLSERGSVAVDERTNTLIVTDVAEKLDALR